MSMVTAVMFRCCACSGSIIRFFCGVCWSGFTCVSKSVKRGVASIGANTNIKICMKLEDPTDTWEFFMKEQVRHMSTVDSFSASQGSMANTYMDTKSAKMDKRCELIY